ncbi:hypothetical protein L3049_18805 [Labilibaculum sp. DW002]|uniref:Uncharacterized protein n=1 Tax=Paralabilibaculum antarcticum TaxID=2912572 RepID=A0ABT5VXQ6_9BACT|nr:hypothetical protein [Labilibaculum sp. DW002]MDE5420045.1 hypothetical protein [Labilibaculum sp. DW002]
MDIIGILFILTVCAFLLYMLYTKIQSLQAIDRLIDEYYSDQEIEVVDISKLNTTEKLKYAVPLMPFFTFYTSGFSLFSKTDESYFRKVDTTDDSGSEQIRYLEITFTNNGVEYIEFDKYDF